MSSQASQDDEGNVQQSLQIDESKLPPVIKRIDNGEKTPVCVIVVGMAGSGKTSLLTRLQESLENKKEESSYCINLDPATLSVPFDVSIDIRDTIDYKQVMKQHKLGPNGAIMTSLNLYTTKFDQVMQIAERRAYEPTEDAPAMDYILVDTPGQIEAFTWSASGSIIGESLASAFPTVLCFVVDTVRCASSPNTFMSNMLYACSMLYRTRLPIVICFNKTDVVSHEFCIDWMKDYETFQQALDDTASSGSGGFYASLTRSLSLVLDEFYSSFANVCGVSAITGAGMDDFWTTVDKAARQDFVTDYVQDLRLRLEEQQAREAAMAESSVERMRQDLSNMSTE